MLLSRTPWSSGLDEKRRRRRRRCWWQPAAPFHRSCASSRISTVGARRCSVDGTKNGRPGRPCRRPGGMWREADQPAGRSARLTADMINGLSTNSFRTIKRSAAQRRPTIHSICCSAVSRIAGGRSAEPRGARYTTSILPHSLVVERTAAVPCHTTREGERKRESCRRSVSRSKNTIHVRFVQQSQRVKPVSSIVGRNETVAVSWNNHQTDTRSKTQSTTDETNKAHTNMQIDQRSF